MFFERKIKLACYRFPLVRELFYPGLALRRIFLKRWVSSALLDRAHENLFAEPPLLSVPEFEGEFRIGVKSDLLHRLLRYSTYEPRLANLARSFVNSERDAIDIGANIGFFSVLLAKHTKGRVFAVEPVPQVLTLLRQNLERNGVASQVSVFEGVISDTSGVAAMEVVNGREEYSSMVHLAHPSVRGKATTRIHVAASTLDDLVLHNDLNVGFVKIDVEGAEHKVLAGARNTLVNMRPVVISEFSPQLLKVNGIDPAEIIKRLREIGYRIVDPLFPELIPGRRTFGDLLAVPEERFSMLELRSLLKITN